MTAPDSLRIIADSHVDVADDPFDALFMFATLDDQEAVLRLDQPVLAGMIADLSRVDRARAVASGFPADGPPLPGNLADAVTGAQPAHFDDPGLRPVASAFLSWDETSPWQASLIFTVDQADWALDLGQSALTALLADLRQLNRERAIQAGWADPDDTDATGGDGDDDDETLDDRLRRRFPARAEVMSLMDRMPQRWQIYVSLGVLGLVIVLIILFNVVL